MAEPEKPTTPDGARGGTSMPSDDFRYLDPPRVPGELGWMGGYRVLRVLGRGGMGVVFEAEDPQLGRRIALKVPHAATDESYRQRFLREGRLAATLPHEHIAAIYQAGQHGGVPFLAMELLRGESLESYLDREKHLSVAEALRITREVAQGLQAAHAAGLVHRDVKPANIFLAAAPHGGPPRVKILDFGVAREVKPAQAITQHGHIVGSVGYMAPEQLVGGDLDGRTDLFALGCLLYRMLYGRLPFTGDNTVASLHAVLHQEPAPSDVTIPAPVQALLDDLLQKDPDRRPASAALVVRRIEEIERALSRPGTSERGTVLRRLVETRPGWGILGGASVVVAAFLIGLLVLADKLRNSPDADPGPAAGGNPITVGILHSLSGPLASTETPVAEITLLAIEEINQAGGVLGRKVEAILEDGRSTPAGFAAAAEKLIQKDQVATLFGCWTSSTRKAVKEVCERHDHLLVYPVNYEGLEQSANIIYVGGGPNQQLIPAAGWVVGMLGKHRFYFVGSDYVYSRASNEILRDRLKALRAEVVGESYVSLQEARGSEFSRIVKKIQASGADVILSTVDGHQANLVFFHALVEADIDAKALPCVSFSFYETELRHLDERDAVGHYAVGNYFQSLPGPVNADFLKRFKAKHPTRVVNDTMEAAYCGVHLWAQAVAEAKSDRPLAIRDALRHQQYEGPEGRIQIDPVTQHALRTARIGRAENNQGFRIVFASPEPMPAEPFPPTRTRAEWEEFLQGLYRGWGNHWEKPSP